jgi:antitoxin component of MazEF toxin-antitoxin module
MTKQKIIKTGHSLAVTIPFDFAQLLGIKAGQEVEVKIEQLSLSGSFKKK